MNDICEMWSLPWHALQKNLALGLSGDAAARAVTAPRTAPGHGTAMSANSWLGAVPGSERRLLPH
jgi:hypothetical protein